MAKKRKRIKEEHYETDEQQEIKRFIIILLVVIVAILGVYFFTKNIVKKTNISFDDTTQAGEIDYSKVTVGTMLTKKEKNYYVLIYDSTDNNASLYSLLKDNYSSNEAALSIYFCDLNNSLNSNYKSDNTNPKATKIEELALGEITLIKVSNSKISKYIEGFDNIKKELNV